jgi:hypothetical protein
METDKQIIGKYVETEEYKREVEKYGFRYSPITRSLFLAYPYLPTKFSHYAVRVNLYHEGVSSLSKIGSVEYYIKGSDYEKTMRPCKSFKEYIERILEEGLAKARPRYVLT